MSPARGNQHGHVFVKLRDGGRETRRGVHILVLEAFVGPRPEGHWGLHRNDVPDDNRVENLYWGTPGQNGADSVANLGHRNAKKIECIRGHVLEGANLMAAEVKRGRRKCRACHQAHVTFSNALVRDPGALAATPEALQAEADRRYAAIMNSI